MKRPTSFRLSGNALILIAALSEQHGVSQTAIVEMAVREKAKRDGVAIRVAVPKKGAR